VLLASIDLPTLTNLFISCNTTLWCADRILKYLFVFYPEQMSSRRCLNSRISNDKYIYANPP
jgi:hypothetical protein